MKNNVGRLTIPGFKTYYKAIVIEIVCVCVWGGGGGTSRRTGTQTNRIESSEINSNIYSQMIFNKGANTIQWEKNTLFHK